MRTRQDRRRSLSGLTRMDLLILLATAALLLVWTLPLLAGNKARSAWMTCFNNLRLLGQSVQVWGDDHHGNIPWRTLISEGGTMPDSGTKPGVAWIEWTPFSNALPAIQN